MVWNTPSTRSAVKYWKAVRYDRIVTKPNEHVPMSPAVLCDIFIPASPKTTNESRGSRSIKNEYSYIILRIYHFIFSILFT